MADMEAIPGDEPDGEAMSDDELAALLAAHEVNAVGYYTSDIADEQAESLKYYYGRPFGDEQAGRSQVVDRTVAIVIDNAVAAIMKPFVSSDEAVCFEPVGPEDEEAAEQATEYVNHVFNVDNQGFLLLHNWFKAALLEKLGIVKCWWEDQTHVSKTTMDGLTAQDIEGLEQDEELTIKQVYQDGEFFSVEVERTEQAGRIRIVTVPSEEFLIASYARDIESAEYVAHKPTNVTRSDLVAMGFDSEVIEGLPAASQDGEESRTLARYNDENLGLTRNTLGAGNDPSRDVIAILDEYVMVDYDGDGISELRRVIRVDDVILMNIEVDDNPFATLCPVPMQHKVYGLSLADQTRDLQRISSVLWRQTLDNLYLANNPKTEVPAAAERPDGTTMNDLQDTAPGGVVRTQAPGLINAIVIPFVADKSFPMLEYAEQQQEARTGVGRSGQGIDTNTLRKSGQMTATEIAEIASGKNARVEMIARIFAETGVKRLFRQMLKLLIEHQPKARMMRLRNKWVEIDPRKWNAEMDLSISVGLGMGSEVERLAKADSVIQMMAEVVGGPPQFAALIGAEEGYHAIKKKLNAAGIKDVENYIKDPSTQPPQEPQPDPEMQKVQAELQMKQQELEMKAQAQQADMQMKSQEGQLKIELAREEAAAKLELEQAKAQQEAMLAEQKFAFEAQLAERKMELESEMAKEQAARQHEIAKKTADAKISQNRSGGDLSK